VMMRDTASSEMQEEDWEVVEELSAACHAVERQDTFYPLFQGCAICKGFIFGESVATDVKRQLGVCGCVVALEMEMRDAGLLATAPLEHATALQTRTTYLQGKDALMVALLAGVGPAHGHRQTRDELYYLRGGRRRLREHPAQRARATRSMLTRHRMNSYPAVK